MFWKADTILETPIGTRFRVVKMAKDGLHLIHEATGQEIVRDVLKGEMGGWQVVRERSSSQPPSPALPMPHPSSPEEDCTIKPSDREAWEAAHRNLVATGHLNPVQAACEATGIPLHLGESWSAESLFIALVWRYAMHPETDSRKGKLAWEEVKARLGVTWDAEEARQRTKAAMLAMTDEGMRKLFLGVLDRAEKQKQQPKTSSVLTLSEAA